jgi:hypothetical protein
VNAIMSQVLLWGSIMLYIDEMKLGKEANNAQDYNNSEEVEQLTEERLITIRNLISSVWVVSVVLFFGSLNKDYINSFVGTATANTYVKQCWDWQMIQNPRVADESIVKVRASLSLFFSLHFSLTHTLTLSAFSS